MTRDLESVLRLVSDGIRGEHDDDSLRVPVGDLRILLAAVAERDALRSVVEEIYNIDADPLDTWGAKHQYSPAQTDVIASLVAGVARS